MSKSENARMSADIIPAGDSGEFRITDEMLVESGGEETMWALELRMLEEARKRNLRFSMQYSPLEYATIVRWRPDTRRVEDEHV